MLCGVISIAKIIKSVKEIKVCDKDSGRRPLCERLFTRTVKKMLRGSERDPFGWLYYGIAMAKVMGNVDTGRSVLSSATSAFPDCLPLLAACAHFEVVYGAHQVKQCRRDDSVSQRVSSGAGIPIQTIELMCRIGEVIGGLNREAGGSSTRDPLNNHSPHSPHSSSSNLTHLRVLKCVKSITSSLPHLSLDDSKGVPLTTSSFFCALFALMGLTSHIHGDGERGWRLLMQFLPPPSQPTEKLPTGEAARGLEVMMGYTLDLIINSFHHTSTPRLIKEVCIEAVKRFPFNSSFVRILTKTMTSSGLAVQMRMTMDCFIRGTGTNLTGTSLNSPHSTTSLPSPEASKLLNTFIPALTPHSPRSDEIEVNVDVRRVVSDVNVVMVREAVQAELDSGNPSHRRCVDLLEESVTKDAGSPSLWLVYIKLLITSLTHTSLFNDLASLMYSTERLNEALKRVTGRAVHHCPYAKELWLHHMKALENDRNLIQIKLSELGFSTSETLTELTEVSDLSSVDEMVERLSVLDERLLECVEQMNDKGIHFDIDPITAIV
eukprot:GHVN01039235.1.p1 GENE.GHVN01039235.1~~GHVN01039235.1.p1  ORF type:complete len:602 (-),score=219.79 GHVN01039235.1:332-1975(-)